MVKWSTLALLVCVVLLGTQARAAVYKCTDAAGKVVFTDKPCAGSDGATIDARDLPPVNASGSAPRRDTRPSGGGNQQDYYLREENGNVRQVTREQYLDQLQKNQTARRRQALRERMTQPSELDTKRDKARKCLDDRRALPSAKGKEAEAIRARLEADCGGV